MNSDGGRAQHYRDFYRPDSPHPGESLPLWLVVGNCQAEALRLVLDGIPDRPYRTARIPPVHELEPTDLPFLHSLLAETAVLVSQPVRQNYRGLPIGTAELATMLPAGAEVVRWPVIRYAGLYPFQVIVRDPADRSVTPPVVPYHDLRTLVAARDGLGAGDVWDVEVSPDAVRAIADLSVAELARREHLFTDVGVSDVLLRHGADAAHTINHPGNAVLVDLASRILDLRGVTAAPATPTRPLLASVYAPLEARVLRALGLSAPARELWLSGGEEITAQRVHAAQLRWYRDHPAFISLAAQRHRQTVEILGLSAGKSR